MSTQPAPAAAGAAPPKKKGRALLFIVLGLVVLGGGGGGFWWWKHSAKAAEAGQEAKPKKDATGILALEPFVVNLADREASRFLRVTIKLVVETEHEAKEIEEHPVSKSRIRSALLELLSAQESAKLVTPEGKAELKKLIAERASEAAHTEVHDVLFTDFVVQF